MSIISKGKFLEVEDAIENEQDLLGSIITSLSSTITQANDWTVGTIIDLIGRGKIVLNPEFQRRDAWRKDRKTKFIESVLLGFPVPQIVLAESKTERGVYYVIDGKQRLLSLLSAVGIDKEDLGLSVKPIKLNGFEILTDFNNKTLKQIKLEQFYQNQLDEFDTRTIRTVVIRHWNDENILYHIFLRLNTGSVQLSPQELRNAIHPGKFASFIDIYSGESLGLRKILNNKQPDFRMRDAEILLRFYGFKLFLHTYNGSMKDFLDITTKELNDRWDDESNSILEMSNQFEAAIEAVYTIFDNDAFRKWKDGGFEDRFNRAVYDIMMYYFSSQDVRDAAVQNKTAIKDKYIDLSRRDPKFVDSLETTTKSLGSTIYRLNAWGNAINEVLEVKSFVPSIQDGQIMVR